MAGSHYKSHVELWLSVCFVCCICLFPILLIAHQHPYGISYLQVSDSAKQNGCFKMYKAKVKTYLLEKKRAARLPFAIERTDIVLIIREAWKKSFAWVRTNIKAVAEWGWGLLNFNCLMHPELQMTTSQQGTQGTWARAETVVAPQQLNLNDSMAGTLIDKVVEYKNWEWEQTGNDAAEQAIWHSTAAWENISCSKENLHSGWML